MDTYFGPVIDSEGCVVVLGQPWPGSRAERNPRSGVVPEINKANRMSTHKDGAPIDKAAAALAEGQSRGPGIQMSKCATLGRKACARRCSASGQPSMRPSTSLFLQAILPLQIASIDPPPRRISV